MRNVRKRVFGVKGSLYPRKKPNDAGRRRRLDRDRLPEEGPQSIKEGRKDQHEN